MTDPSREQWLKDTQDFFRDVQSYNATIITVGYATFFGLLLFLQDKVKSPLLFWAGLFVAISAALFVSFELVNQIRVAITTYKTGTDGKRFIRFWAFFFIPSLLLAIAGSVLLVYLFLCNLAASYALKRTVRKEVSGAIMRCGPHGRLAYAATTPCPSQFS